MGWDVYSNIQRLCLQPTASSIQQLKSHLSEFGTLSLIANEHNIYSASSSLSADDHSGYQHAWLRDNVMIAYSKWFCGNRESALRTTRSLQNFLVNQLRHFQDIIEAPALKEDISRRPRVRFNAHTLEELSGEWANAQNDALGAVIWLRFLMANEDAPETPSRLTEEECTLYQHILRYLEAIQYWSDHDSGAWEETRKLNTSSVGAVLAGLKQIMRYGEQCAQPETLALTKLADKLYKIGLPVLARLPFESPPNRRADAALLFLIFPFAIVNDAEVQDQILSLVRARLMGSFGIRRYIGDSYYCQNYDEWFSPASRTADFSRNIEFRDELLVPGHEAQWCLFDPILSTIYGLRSGKSRDLQILHFQRSIRQLTKDLCCPELYYSKNGRYIPNHHTPLAWTQANLAIALHLLEGTISL